MTLQAFNCRVQKYKELVEIAWRKDTNSLICYSYSSVHLEAWARTWNKMLTLRANYLY